MAQQTSELAFEKELCHHLETHGWLYSPDDTGYDPVRALYPDDVFAWLEETQPGELAKRVKPDASPEARPTCRCADGCRSQVSSSTRTRWRWQGCRTLSTPATRDLRTYHARRPI